jgi:hypothetical protein
MRRILAAFQSASENQKVMERGFHEPGDAENRLGHYFGQLGIEILGKSLTNIRGN